MADVLLFPVPLDSGFTALVRPLSPFTRAAIIAAATARFPDPDREPYRRPLENAFQEGLLENAEDNPQYAADLKNAREKRMSAIYESVLRTNVVAGTEEATCDELLARYQSYIADLRGIADGVPDDDWMAITLNVLIASNNDAIAIAEAALQSVTREGVRKAGSIFCR